MKRAESQRASSRRLVRVPDLSDDAAPIDDGDGESRRVILMQRVLNEPTELVGKGTRPAGPLLGGRDGQHDADDGE